MATAQQSPFHRTVNIGTMNTSPDVGTAVGSPNNQSNDSIKDYIAKLKVSIKPHSSHFTAILIFMSESNR